MIILKNNLMRNLITIPQSMTFLTATTGLTATKIFHVFYKW